jgi:hypothetical protein
MVARGQQLHRAHSIPVHPRRAVSVLVSGRPGGPSCLVARPGITCVRRPKPLWPEDGACSLRRSRFVLRSRPPLRVDLGLVTTAGDRSGGQAPCPSSDGFSRRRWSTIVDALWPVPMLIDRLGSVGGTFERGDTTTDDGPVAPPPPPPPLPTTFPLPSRSPWPRRPETMDNRFDRASPNLAQPSNPTASPAPPPPSSTAAGPSSAGTPAAAAATTSASPQTSTVANAASKEPTPGPAAAGAGATPSPATGTPAPGATAAAAPASAAAAPSAASAAAQQNYRPLNVRFVPSLLAPCIRGELGGC